MTFEEYFHETHSFLCVEMARGKKRGRERESFQPAEQTFRVKILYPAMNSFLPNHMKHSPFNLLTYRQGRLLSLDCHAIISFISKLNKCIEIHVMHILRSIF